LVSSKFKEMAGLSSRAVESHLSMVATVSMSVSMSIAGRMMGMSFVDHLGSESSFVRNLQPQFIFVKIKNSKFAVLNFTALEC